MKKILYKALYKVGALFYKLHKLFYNPARSMELPDLPLSDQNKIKWYADKVEGTLRYEYNLNKSSVVLDVGGYEGDFASEIFARYLCEIHIFEPVSGYVTKLRKRFNNNPSIKVIPKGLGAASAELEISVMDEASSITRGEYMNKEGGKEKISIVGVSEFLTSSEIDVVDLIKINIEGAEYDLLDRMIDLDILKRFRNLQIQFHDFYPGYKERYERIKESLSKTHKLTYQYPFVWENWELKS